MHSTHVRGVRPRGDAVLLTAAVALCVCYASAVAADPREIYLQQTPGQDVHYTSGTGWITTGDDVVASVSVHPDSRKRAWLTVLISNNSTRPITVSDTDVRAEAAGRTLEVLTAEDVLKAERRRQGWQKFGAGLAMGLNSYAASQQGRYTSTGHFDAYGSGGRVRGNVTVYGVDQVARQQALANANQTNLALADQLNAQHQARSQDLAQRLFRAQTINPGESYGGDIAFRLPPRASGPQPVALHLSIDNSPRTFFVFVDGAPSADQRARLAQVAVHPDDARRKARLAANNPAPPQPSPVAAPSPAVQTTAVASSSVASPSTVEPPTPQPIDRSTRNFAAARLFAEEAYGEAYDQALVAFASMLYDDLINDESVGPVRAKFKAEPARTKSALAATFKHVMKKEDLLDVIASVLAEDYEYEELMTGLTFARTAVGRRLLSVPFNVQFWMKAQARFPVPAEDAFEQARIREFKAAFPEVDSAELFE